MTVPSELDIDQYVARRIQAIAHRWDIHPTTLIERCMDALEERERWRAELRAGTFTLRSGAAETPSGPPRGAPASHRAP